MSFSYPLGLLGLLGIPVLILIYIIKSKYTEQTIPSTYLWELSERFLKRKKPISKITGIISLILQILIVVCISVTIAHPVFTVPNSAKEYCFILDASGSMNTEQNGETRFDAAKNEIKSIIKSSQTGSNYALVYVGDTTYSVFDGLNNKKSANMLIDDLACSWSGTSCAEGVSIAQQYFDENKSTLVYLVTDKDYTAENITVVNVSDGGENYAVFDYACEKKFDSETQTTGYSVTGALFSYESDATLTVELYVNEEKTEEQQIEVKKLEKTEFEFVANVTEYRSIEIRIVNEDGFMKDNSVVFYEATAGDALPTLIVGNNPFYIRSVISAVSNTDFDVMNTAEYEAYYEAYKNGEGKLYGLYVFDCYSPEELPTGGTIWLINAQASIPKSGFTFQKVENEDGRQDRYVADFSVSTEPLVRTLTKDLINTSVNVFKYAKYAVNRSFTTVLACRDTGAPLVFAGLNENNDKEVVFAFDIHDADISLSINYLVLVRNLLKYSSPSVIEETMFTTGDTVTFNVLNGCTALVLTAPSGKPTPLTTSSALVETQLTESGTYRLTATVNDVEQQYLLFAGVPESESNPQSVGVLAIQGTPEADYANGYYDQIIVYLILLAVIFMADWGVYCYEQYQLR